MLNRLGIVFQEKISFKLEVVRMLFPENQAILGNRLIN